MKRLLVVKHSRIAAAAHFAAAQQTINYATVSGLVTDPSGAPVESVEVTAKQIDTNISSTENTGRDGRYLFPYLRIGAYEIRVRKAGFQEAMRPVTLTVGAAFDVPFALVVGQMSTSVQVNDDAPVLETARTQVAGTVSRAEIADLPLSGRNYFDVALFVLSAVSPTNAGDRTNCSCVRASQVPGQGISVSSQRNFSNSYIIDGVSANDDAAGVAGAFIGLDVVQEFQVVTSGGQAELGRALGGYMNVVTRSGGNALHGDAYGYFRNSRFNAANPISHAVLPLTQGQYGGSLGGPVVRDRTFYFANFEIRDLNQAGLVTIAPASVAAINARLDALTIRVRGFRHGRFFQSRLQPMRISLRSSIITSADRDQFSARYNLYHVDSLNSRGAGGLSAPSASANLFDTDQTVAASNIFTISPRVVNETRVQFTNSNLAAPPSGSRRSRGQHRGRGVVRHTFPDRLRLVRTGCTKITDSVSVQRGAHAIRLGADFLYNDDTIVFPRALRGSYAFSSLANFLSGTYSSAGYTQTFGVPQVHQTNPNAGFYLPVMSIGSSPHLTLNLRCPVRSPIPADHRHSDRQRVATRGVRLDPIRLAAHGAARRLRTFLRPDSSAAPGERAALRRQYGSGGKSSAVHHHSFARPDCGAGISEHPEYPDDSVRRVFQLHHDGPQSEERVFGAGKLRD